MSKIDKLIKLLKSKAKNKDQLISSTQKTWSTLESILRGNNT